MEHIQKHKIRQLKHNHLLQDTYPIIQHTDFTPNTNETEYFTQSNQNANYTELINTIKFSFPGTADFIPKSPKLYNYFYSEQTELNDTLLYEAQNQDPVTRQLLIWKRYKNYPTIFLITIRANKRLLHYYRSFQNLSINETNHLFYCTQETTSPKICLPLSLLLVIFHVTLSHDLSGDPGREKTHATIRENFYFPNIHKWIAKLMQDCLNW